jgi:hypothetical protein
VELSIAREAAALRRLTIAEMRARYAEVFGEPTNAHNRIWLVRRIAWRLQALAEGDLSERARRRAEELANGADLRLGPPRSKAVEQVLSEAATVAAPSPRDDRLPPPGTILVRPFRGQNLQVQILTDGFAFESQVYRSLSAVARAITGSHCNGFHFFRCALNGQGGER